MREFGQHIARLTRRELLQAGGLAALALLARTDTLSQEALQDPRLQPRLLHLPKETEPRTRPMTTAAFLRGSALDSVTNPAEINFSQLDHLQCFGIPVDSRDGSLITNLPAYTNFSSEKGRKLLEQAQAQGTTTSLTFTMLADTGVRDFLEKPELHSTTAKNIAAEVKKGEWKGINIDFESVLLVRPELRSRFTAFMKELADTVRQDNPKTHVSVCITPSRVDNAGVYDLATLNAICDQLYLMTYAYGSEGSTRAIPPSPLDTGDIYWDAMRNTIKTALKYVKPDKLVAGFPLYGLEFQTEFPGANGEASSGKAITYSYVQNLLDEKPSILQGTDHVAHSRWLAERTTNGYKTIVWDDAESLAAKTGVFEQMGLGGVMFWALDQATYSQSYELNDVLEVARAKFEEKGKKEIVTFTNFDMWQQEAKNEGLVLGTAEMTLATILSTLNRHIATPLQLAKELHKRGIRTPDGVFIRSLSKQPDVVSMLAQLGYRVNEIIDRYHPDDKLQQKRGEAFNYKRTKWFLKTGNMVLASGNILDPVVTNVICPIIDVNENRNTITILNPVTGNLDMLQEHEFKTIYAYAVGNRAA